MASRFCLAALPLGLFLAPFAAKADEYSPVSYEGRDGIAEARADLANGGQAHIYTVTNAMRGPIVYAPGLRFCGGHRLILGPEGPSFFKALPEGDYSEGSGYRYDPAIAKSALDFARAYNAETFRLREAEVRVACPKVELEPRQ